MRTPVSEASTCESWSIAIEEQRKALRAEQSDQRECSSSFAEAMPSPTLLARNHELFSLFVSLTRLRCLCGVFSLVNQNIKASFFSINRKRRPLGSR